MYPTTFSPAPTYWGLILSAPQGLDLALQGRLAIGPDSLTGFQTHLAGLVDQYWLASAAGSRPADTRLAAKLSIEGLRLGSLHRQPPPEPSMHRALVRGTLLKVAGLLGEIPSERISEWVGETRKGKYFADDSARIFWGALLAAPSLLRDLAINTDPNLNVGNPFSALENFHAVFPSLVEALRMTDKPADLVVTLARAGLALEEVEKDTECARLLRGLQIILQGVAEQLLPWEADGSLARAVASLRVMQGAWWFATVVDDTAVTPQFLEGVPG